MKTATIKLSNGILLPQVGFGTWKISDGEPAAKAVVEALETGYTLIDTATIYDNESGIGQGLKKTNIPRENYQITTKVWNTDQGYDPTLRAFEASLKRLDLTYIDNYLIHWPTPTNRRYHETWRALEHLYKEGLVKAIGVCNFNREHLEDLSLKAEIQPMINQIECHVGFQQNALRQYCQQQQIAIQAWRPLADGHFFDNPIIQTLTQKYHKTAAQIMLRFLVQEEMTLLVKSSSKKRMIDNLAIFDFTLEQADIAQLKTLDSPTGRLSGDPLVFGD